MSIERADSGPNSSTLSGRCFVTNRTGARINLSRKTPSRNHPQAFIRHTFIESRAPFSELRSYCRKPRIPFAELRVLFRKPRIPFHKLRTLFCKPRILFRKPPLQHRH